MKQKIQVHPLTLYVGPYALGHHTILDERDRKLLELLFVEQQVRERPEAFKDLRIFVKCFSLKRWSSCVAERTGAYSRKSLPEISGHVKPPSNPIFSQWLRSAWQLASSCQRFGGRHVY